jgi:hypothetical protein
VENYATMRDSVLGFMPYPVRVVVGLLAYRNVAAGLHYQGTGRYTVDEIKGFKMDIWRTVNDLLVTSRAAHLERSDDEDKAPFWALGHPEPTELDATLFGFVASVLMCEA